MVAVEFNYLMAMACYSRQKIKCDYGALICIDERFFGIRKLPKARNYWKLAALMI